jgi:hypothetical protein
MSQNPLTIIALSITIAVAATGVARADCESDLIQLEQAYKAPALTTVGKAALDDSKTKALAAFKKDDDATCHKAVAEGMTKVGMTLK